MKGTLTTESRIEMGDVDAVLEQVRVRWASVDAGFGPDADRTTIVDTARNVIGVMFACIDTLRSQRDAARELLLTSDRNAIDARRDADAAESEVARLRAALEASR